VDAEQIVSGAVSVVVIVANQLREGRKTRKKVDPVANGFAADVTAGLNQISDTLNEHVKDSATTHDAMWRAITGRDG